MVEQSVQTACFTNPTILAHLCLQSQAWLTWPPLALRAPPLQSSTRRVVFNGIQNIFATFKVYYRSSFFFFKKTGGRGQQLVCRGERAGEDCICSISRNSEKVGFCTETAHIVKHFFVSRKLLIFIFILHRVW